MVKLRYPTHARSLNGNRCFYSNVKNEIARSFRTFCALSGVLVLVGTLLIVSNSYGASSVPKEDPTYDWFKLGNDVAILLDRYWNTQIDHASEAPYQRISELMTKLHVPDSTLQSFQEWKAQVMDLTWRTDPDAAFGKARSKASAWYSGLENQATNSASSRFFFLLGYHSGKIFRVQGLDVGYGYPELKLSEEDIVTFRNASHDLHAFSTDTEYKALFAPLSPDIQHAITKIGSFDAKLAAGASLSQDDVYAFIFASEDLKDAGSAGVTFYPAQGGEWLRQHEFPVFL